jgi:hypothetical protein
MVRLAHHERLGWVGSPRTAGLGGLTTNGWVGWAYHELVDWVGSPRTAGLGGLTANGWVGWAHRERLGWVGSPRMGSWAGVPWSRSWFDRLTTNGGGEGRSWFDWLTTNGGIGWVHHERLIWWAYHKRVGWVGSSGMGRLRGLTGQLTPRPVAAENRAPICCAGPTVEFARPCRMFGRNSCT